MELQALLVLCGLGVAGMAMFLLMGLFSASGTSYEEAIAQQRRATNELLSLAENKNKPKKKDKKANKKLAKKEKSKDTVLSTGSEVESEAPAESGADEDHAVTTTAEEKVSQPPHRVEFSPPVIVDDETPVPKIRKRKDRSKPILLNKDDPSIISDLNTAPLVDVDSNHFVEMHPKDELELMIQRNSSSSINDKEKIFKKKEDVVEKKESKPPKQIKGGKVVGKSGPESGTVEIAGDRNTATNENPKDQRKSKKIEKKPSIEDPTPAVEAPKEEVIPPLNAPQPSELTTEKLLKQVVTTANANTSSPPGGKNKKKKPEPNVLSLMAAGDGGGVNVGELVRVVREAALSRTEIQILTDALLNKHHDPLPQHSEWTEGPNDPMQKLKKQLADKEKALADEIEASQALHAKLKELRTTLNSERGRAAAAARAAEQSGAAARVEMHTLQARLQRLCDENHALAQEKLVLQSKLGAEGDAQAQRVQMEMHIQRLSEAEAALVQQLQALQAELNGRVLEAGQARCEANAARDSMIMAQQHAAELAQQLQEANRAYSELEQQRQCAAHAEQLAQQELRAMQERLAALTELQNEVQRQTARAQTAETNAEKLKEELENHKHQLSSEVTSLKEQSASLQEQIASLQEQLASRDSELVSREAELAARDSELAARVSELALRESELAELKLLKAAPAQNGLPSNSDEHKPNELAKVESVVEILRGELAAAQRNSIDQRQVLATLQEKLQEYTLKNNELRTKNWKVMEALQSAEKSLQAKASAIPAQESLRDALAKAQETHYTEVANVLRSACPSAAATSAPGKEWLQTFADNLKKELEKKDAEKRQLEKLIEERKAEKVEQNPDTRLAELQAQNEHLQGLVDKYKRIIDDTEGVLSRLQQNVTTEEQRWAQQLSDKQRELDELRQRTVLQEPLAFAYSCIEKSLPTIMEEMQNKIDTLQTELQQARANHNHSFADTERLTEERLLMAGLSNKQSQEACNGPLQVGLEEK